MPGLSWAERTCDGLGARPHGPVGSPDTFSQRWQRPPLSPRGSESFHQRTALPPLSPRHPAPKLPAPTWVGDQPPAGGLSSTSPAPDSRCDLRQVEEGSKPQFPYPQNGCGRFQASAWWWSWETNRVVGEGPRRRVRNPGGGCLCGRPLRALPAQRPAAAGAPPQANPTPCTVCPPHSFPGHAHPAAPQPAPQGPTALSPPWGSRIGQPHPCTEPSPQNLVLKSYFPFQEIETPPRIAGTKLGMCGPPQRPSPRGRRLQVCLDPGPSSTEGGKGLSTAHGSHGVAGPFGWAAFRAGLCRISRIAGWREGHQGRA